MKILVVGGGGREHAIIKKLRESPRAGELFCAPGNAGIAADAVCLPYDATDIAGIAGFAAREKIGLAVVAPEGPLVMGMADALEADGIPCFGPSAAAAAIEGSKVFAKRLMEKYGIPTARYRSFEDAGAAIRYLRGQPRWPMVIKADGLALGKGVVIADDLATAIEAVRGMMEQKAFGTSGSRVIIEEHLTGPEASVLAFCDGKTALPLVSAMDHKRALDGNAGPNTGGMGAVAPNPHYTAAVAERCTREIIAPTVAAMTAEGRPFKGFLYFGLMLTPDGPKVIEYNCRLGDPEAQVLLPLLDTDLTDIMLAAREGKLESVTVAQKKGATACVVLASGGYPGHYRTGLPIAGLDASGQLPGSGATVFHAGTKHAPDGSFLTNGGRVLGIAATAQTPGAALSAAYRAVEGISFEGMHFRRDIGTC